MRTGTTLIELVVALLLLGVITGLSRPPLGRLRDRAAVFDARERFIALVRETRSVAVERGGARLLLDSRGSTALLVSGPDTLQNHRWSPPGGAAFEILGARDQAALAFDAAGIGRFSSLTVAFVRGAEEAGAIVSSYGRVRRR